MIVKYRRCVCGRKLIERIKCEVCKDDFKTRKEIAIDEKKITELRK